MILYARDNINLLAESYYEFWHAKIGKMKEDKVSNRTRILLQNSILSQINNK